MIVILMFTLTASTMMVSFQLGVESIASCTIYNYMLLPIHVIGISTVVIAADKAQVKDLQAQKKDEVLCCSANITGS